LKLKRLSILGTPGKTCAVGQTWPTGHWCQEAHNLLTDPSAKNAYDIQVLANYYKMRMMHRTICMLIVTLASSAVLANEFKCQANNETRVISVEYEHKGWQVPCKVKYEKPAGGLTEYPWSAQASPGYCENRAAFLAGKLKNWGWTCEEQPLESKKP
jgi:hypothetical protein